MRELVTVKVVCNHRRGGEGEREEIEEIIHSYAYSRDRDGPPKGTLTGGGRLLSGGQVRPDHGRRQDTVMALAREGLASKAVHQLRCETCGLTERVLEVKLRQALELVAEPALR